MHITGCAQWSKKLCKIVKNINETDSIVMKIRKNTHKTKRFCHKILNVRLDHKATCYHQPLGIIGYFALLFL